MEIRKLCYALSPEWKSGYIIPMLTSFIVPAHYVFMQSNRKQMGKYCVHVFWCICVFWSHPLPPPLPHPWWSKSPRRCVTLCYFYALKLRKQFLWYQNIISSCKHTSAMYFASRKTDLASNFWAIFSINHKRNYVRERQKGINKATHFCIQRNNSYLWRQNRCDRSSSQQRRLGYEEPVGCNEGSYK